MKRYNILEPMEQKRVIEESKLFDKVFYNDFYYQFVKYEPDLVWHYIMFGAAQGFNPSPLFDTRFYESQVEGLAESGLNPLYHYIKYGINESRFTLPSRDENSNNGNDFYSEWCNKAIKGAENKRVRYFEERFLLNCGEFDFEYYELESGISHDDKRGQIRHYIQKGMYEGLNPHPMFNTRFYVNQYGKSNFMKIPYIHYLKQGRKLGFLGLDVKELHNLKNDYRQLCFSYYRLKTSYSQIESIFNSSSLITGCLLNNTINNVKKTINIGSNLFLNIILDGTDGLEVKKLLWSLEKSRYPFNIRILPDNPILKDVLSKCATTEYIKVQCTWNKNDIMDGEFLWKISNLNMEMVENILSYFTYCVDEGILAVLIDKDNRRYGEIIPTIDLIKPQIYNKRITINQCIIKKCLLDSFSNQDIRPESFITSVDGGKILKVYEPLADQLEETEILKPVTEYKHIMISIYAFSYGGGEIMPIRLANQLKKMGYPILVHVFGNQGEESKVRNMLLPRIPIVRTNEEEEMALIIKEFQIDVISSHHQTVQSFLARVLKKNPEIRKQVRHVATSHGMYNAFSDKELKTILEGLEGTVDCWTYVADKNIEPFVKAGSYNKVNFIKIPNGMEKPVIHPIARSELGIDDNAFVFCLASRAIPEKGWEEATQAVIEARKKSEKDIHLILIGNGPVYEKMIRNDIPYYIHLLGFKDNPCDYYAISDAMILPSYYPSESAPLSIIEALQCGIPVIASDIGDIRQMLIWEQKEAGIVFTLDSGKVTVAKVTSCILKLITDHNYYERCKIFAKLNAKRYQINIITEKYLKLFFDKVE